MTTLRLPFRLPIDPYLLALVATVALAALLPARGIGERIMDGLCYGAVAALFFLYGARLSRKAVIEGLSHWRLQSMVFMSTFVLFPAIGLAVTTLFRSVLPTDVLLGLLFVCILPSTVQSSIAFTSIARGNVPAALCCASVSNLFGIVLTPALVALLMGGRGAPIGLGAIADIGTQLLLPFAAGQLVRPLIGDWLGRHKTITAVVDRGSILLIVYSAFSAGMVAGIWSKVTIGTLALIIGLDLVMLALVLIATTVTSRLAGFSREDEIAIVFCGSKKSMAGGIPMANILFPGHAVGLIVLPLMLFHQAQLFACATLARRYARGQRPDDMAVAGYDAEPEIMAGAATAGGASRL